MKNDVEMLKLFSKAINKVTNVYKMKFKDKKDKVHFICTQWFKNYLLIHESYTTFKMRYNADDCLIMQFAIYKYIKYYDIVSEDENSEVCAILHFDTMFER